MMEVGSLIEVPLLLFNKFCKTLLKADLRLLLPVPELPVPELPVPELTALLSFLFDTEIIPFVL
ncbi:hypothetical protein ACFSE3_22530 [Peribacillus frigoritolerans]|uniref:hypothetical protein n=1 Tax=Peribacillus frigoritolerans TaxID=450367 RepID=UPI00106D3C16|nr:hypothetical protein [Peribacillus frigoritolerans]